MILKTCFDRHIPLLIILKNLPCYQVILACNIVEKVVKQKTCLDNLNKAIAYVSVVIMGQNLYLRKFLMGHRGIHKKCWVKI